MLAACATTSPQTSLPVAQEAANYQSHARAYYAPPGPADDPWGPYIDEASHRFDVPDIWIRSVMHQESGGHEFIGGQLVTSAPGAMGLMQLMPPTYDDMRAQYGLGGDPFEPHDNIMAGTAYIRQMYEIYGSPGFLAAYNTGPGRLDDFLTRNRALPHETRQYVAIIGPQIAGIYPNSRSQADLMVAGHQTGGGVVVAAAQSPGDTRAVRMAWARRRDHEAGADQPVQVAEAPASPGAAPSAYQPGWSPVASTRQVWASRMVSAPPVSEPVVRVAGGIPARPVAPGSQRFHAVQPAIAESAHETRPMPHAGLHDWAIQVGAFGTVGQASQAVGTARSRVHGMLPAAHTEIAGIRAGRGGARVYRARLIGLSRGDALQACQKLSRGRSQCMVVSPDQRS